MSGTSMKGLKHGFRYVMAEKVSLHRLAQIIDHDSLNTTRSCAGLKATGSGRSRRGLGRNLD